MEENERLEDANERLRKAAESEDERGMVVRIGTPAIVYYKKAERVSTMTGSHRASRNTS